MKLGSLYKLLGGQLGLGLRLGHEPEWIINHITTISIILLTDFYAKVNELSVAKLLADNWTNLEPS